jgi:hypothetical protein
MKRRHEELKLREEGRVEGKARKIKTIPFADLIQSISTYRIASYSLSSLLLIGAVIISTCLEICSLFQGMIN